jgi:hypothetical protein
MANPLRLNPNLVEAAERAGMVQKRSTPKQIEFWASLGQAVENVLNYEDIFAILKGLKKITLEPAMPNTADPEDVFSDLENSRTTGALAGKIVPGRIYFEASRSRPGLLDCVDTSTGVRRTGQFRNGEFTEIPA